jgi:hypothetical protein
MVAETAPRSPAATHSEIPVGDLYRALDHYQTLGFGVSLLDEEMGVAVVQRFGAILHLLARGTTSVHAPRQTTVVVRDAGSLAVEWSRPGIAGTTVFPQATEDGWQEGIHADPDGNVIRFRSQ